MISDVNSVNKIKNAPDWFKVKGVTLYPGDYPIIYNEVKNQCEIYICVPDTGVINIVLIANNVMKHACSFNGTYFVVWE